MNNITNDQFGIPEKDTYNALKAKLHPGLFGKFKSGISADKAHKTKALSIHNVDVPNLDFLRFFPNLESLLLSSPTLNSLSGLQYTPKLACINFSGKWSKGIDLGPVANCPLLEELDIAFAGQYTRETYATSNVSAIGLDALRKLRKLKYFGLSGMGIRDIGWIAEMESLEDIDLSYNPLSDLTPLTMLKQVNELDLNGCGLNDISALAQLSGLEILCLEANHIRDFIPLKALGKLKEVYAEDNGLTAAEIAEWQAAFKDIEEVCF